MARLFYGNFDFEEQLGGRQPMRSTGRRRLQAELAWLWLAIAEEGDLIWTPVPFDDEPRLRCDGELEKDGDGEPGRGPNRLTGGRFVASPEEILPGLHFVPWGWTVEAIKFAEEVEAVVDAPPLKAVRDVNSRAFSHERERNTGCCIVSTEVATSWESLKRVVESWSDLPDGWVVKAEFSNSSRERYRHHDGPVDWSQLAKWARRRLSHGQQLFCEPWLDRLDEAGVQIEVPRVGPPKLVGIIGQITSQNGEHLGVDFTPNREEALGWQPAIDAAMATAAEAQSRGYFGPLGVDAMLYRDHEGQPRLRALQDVNARQTMGRLSLSWRRLLAKGEQGRWCQRDGNSLLKNIDSRIFIPTHPRQIDGQSPLISYAMAIGEST